MAVFSVLFGRKVTATVEFRNAAGALANPDAVRWKLRSPTGAETAVAGFPTPGAGAANPATGQFTYGFTPTRAGRWILRCEGIGAVEQAVEHIIYVEPSQVQSASVVP